jgi:hypothetical protein
MYTHRHQLDAGRAMTTFETMHRDGIVGKLSMFDRMILKGHLTALFAVGAFRAFLSRQGILLKDFKPYVQRATERLKLHAQRIASEARRPFIYLESATTRASGQSKEDYARSLAERDGITRGLICVFSVLEPCFSFDVRGNRATQKLEVVRRRRKCLHFYFYFIDPEFGFMHVRIQSWFPFEIQVYVNGREWLARQLDRLGIGYVREDNCLPAIDDLQVAAALCERFAHRRLPRILAALARRVNPWLPAIGKLGFGSYYWVLDQCEIATDIMFESRKALEALLPDLFEHATLRMSSDDVLRFLGRKPHGNFQGEVTTDLKRRPEGRRVKHRMKRNSIKMYDKGSALRIETTINNPREFKVLRVTRTEKSFSRRWVPMGKGVANLWRYLQVGIQANHRYLEALAPAPLKGEAVRELDDLCRSRLIDGTRHAKLNPISASDCALFAAVLHGEHALNGFRNHDLAPLLYTSEARSPEEAKRRCARICRLIRKLRAHSLIAKVPYSRMYRTTPRGHRLMSAALRFRQSDFPAALREAA